MSHIIFFLFSFFCVYQYFFETSLLVTSDAIANSNILFAETCSFSFWLCFLRKCRNENINDDFYKKQAAETNMLTNVG